MYFDICLSFPADPLDVTGDVEEVVKEEPQLALSSSDMTGDTVGALLASRTVLRAFQKTLCCHPCEFWIRRATKKNFQGK